jgi:hypothetical protein
MITVVIGIIAAIAVIDAVDDVVLLPPQLLI